MNIRRAAPLNCAKVCFQTVLNSAVTFNSIPKLSTIHVIGALLVAESLRRFPTGFTIWPAVRVGWCGDRSRHDPVSPRPACDDGWQEMERGAFRRRTNSCLPPTAAAATAAATDYGRSALQTLAMTWGYVWRFAIFPRHQQWNKIEHRLFSFITKNWRGRPLTSYQVIVNLIRPYDHQGGLDRAGSDRHQPL